MASCEISFPKYEIKKHKQGNQKWFRVILVFSSVKLKKIPDKQVLFHVILCS